MRAYRVPMERVVVVHDDMDVPIATLKLKKSGGHGGHNGLRSLIDVCKTKSFARLKVGPFIQSSSRPPSVDPNPLHCERKRTAGGRGPPRGGRAGARACADAIRSGAAV